MSLNRVAHGISCVRYNPDAMSGTEKVVTGIRSIRLVANNQVVHDTTTGTVAPHSAYLASSSQNASYQTSDLLKLLGALGITNGLSLYVDPTNNGAGTKGTDIFAQKLQDGAARATGSSHTRYRGTSGCAYITGISCQHQQDAVADVVHMYGYDGTNLPIVRTDSLALPTIDIDVYRYGLGPILLGDTAGDNDVTLTKITQMSIDTGIRCLQVSSDGEIYPTLVYIAERKPVLRFTTLDVQKLQVAGVPLYGKFVDYAATAVYLRRKKHGTDNSYYPDADEEHIKFTIGYGNAQPATIFEASVGGQAAASFEIPLYADGSVEPIAVDTTAALPA